MLLKSVETVPPPSMAGIVLDGQCASGLVGRRATDEGVAADLCLGDHLEVVRRCLHRRAVVNGR
jgi:hypothetical protein